VFSQSCRSWVTCALFAWYPATGITTDEPFCKLVPSTVYWLCLVSSEEFFSCESHKAFATVLRTGVFGQSGMWGIWVGCLGNIAFKMC